MSNICNLHIVDKKYSIEIGFNCQRKSISSQLFEFRQRNSLYRECSCHRTCPHLTILSMHISRCISAMVHEFDWKLVTSSAVSLSQYLHSRIYHDFNIVRKNSDRRNTIATYIYIYIYIYIYVYMCADEI